MVDGLDLANRLDNSSGNGVKSNLSSTLTIRQDVFHHEPINNSENYPEATYTNLNFFGGLQSAQPIYSPPISHLESA